MLVEKHGPVEIWQIEETYGPDFYVYSGSRLVRTCPSLGMARDVAAKALD